MSFFVAWQFLTAIPLGRRGAAIQEPGRSMIWFPLIGLIIGSMLTCLYFVLAQVLPTLPAAALLLVAWVAITGGLHLDGFIDSCDGLLAAKPAERRLEIMQDSHVGAYGVVGAVSLLVVKFTALTALLPGERMGWLLLVPVLSRWSIVWAAWRYPLARPAGLAALFRQGLNWPQAAVAGGTALIVALVVSRESGLLIFALIWLFSRLFAAWVQGRIPGLTGDVYGALNELSETLGLLLAVLIGGSP
jgi:adenosylcobinamide-GDP ribazoletransferase